MTKVKPKLLTMSIMRKRSTKTTVFLTVLISLLDFGGLVPVFAPLPSLHNTRRHHHHRHKNMYERKFEIDQDMFWKDGKPFQIIGGDVHYFRILPEYWEDRLLRAKALGLNTIQIYVPWNLHEPNPGKMVFEGFADLVSFLKLCQKLNLLVMLRPGPYICGEWDLGGFPAWLLAIKPALKLRSSDHVYLQQVEKWWGVLLPKVAPLLYENGGPIVMIQIENEFGSYGDDKVYLHHLVTLARKHLGEDVILYTTDGGTWETLEKGAIRGDDIFSAVDFSTGEEPWPIFKLQKKFNAPGKSPPLSSEFYTGWLTHWGEKIAKTDADSTAAYLEKILSQNGSAVLYMAHGGTNFGFYNGANTGGWDVSDYKPDLTSYDYDAPIKESGDVDNAKFKEIRRVIAKYGTASLPSIPPYNKKAGYGPIRLQQTALLFDLLDMIDSANVVKSEIPISMESAGQMFGFLLYISEYSGKDYGSSLLIPKMHDRAQVFISCPSEDNGRRTYVGTIERWSNQALSLPTSRCVSNISLFILVENMGHVNYGPYLFDEKGILSSVYLGGKVLHKWKMISIPFHNLNEMQQISPILQLASSGLIKASGRKILERKSENITNEPAFYSGHFSIDSVNQVKDTFLSFKGWGKGIAYVNDFNIGRFWPSVGPQCNLYVPAPILCQGKNVVVLFELESPHPELVVRSVDQPDFTCSSSKSNVHQF